MNQFRSPILVLPLGSHSYNLWLSCIHEDALWSLNDGTELELRIQSATEWICYFHIKEEIPGGNFFLRCELNHKGILNVLYRFVCEDEDDPSTLDSFNRLAPRYLSLEDADAITCQLRSMQCMWNVVASPSYNIPLRNKLAYHRMKIPNYEPSFHSRMYGKSFMRNLYWTPTLPTLEEE